VEKVGRMGLSNFTPAHYIEGVVRLEEEVIGAGNGTGQKPHSLTDRVLGINKTKPATPECESDSIRNIRVRRKTVMEKNDSTWWREWKQTEGSHDHGGFRKKGKTRNDQNGGKGVFFKTGAKRVQRDEDLL